MDIEAELNVIRDKLTPYILPTIKLTPIAEPAETIWSSKFGGKPYWPKTMAYPQTENGQTLFLLAQLNFAELPPLDDYPQTGILQFFIANDDLYGMDFDKPQEEMMTSPNGYQVVYHPDIENNVLNLNSDVPEARKGSALPLQQEYRLIAVLESEMPVPTDYRFEKYAGDPFEMAEEVGDYLYDHFTADGSKIGGYAYFTQEDPRGYEKHDDWVLLFQMDSEWSESCEIMWGDVGVANFFIEKSALKKGDFSRIWYNWDCS